MNIDLRSLIQKISYIIFSLISFNVYSQFTVCGKVLVGGDGTKDVSVKIVDKEISILTNKQGSFCLPDVPSGWILLMATYNNFDSEIIPVFINDNLSDIVLEIAAGPNSLDEITIVGKTKVESKREDAIKTEVIDLKKQQLSSKSVEQLMNRSTGIRVRNNNGLGGESDLVVGGFSGKSVKFLIDGIPIDYLGNSMSITKIPTNKAAYIEVYKGVLPTEIGIDALGAAVNIVSNNEQETSTKISYQAGSFNTHRLTLSSFIHKSDKISFGINAFSNYSDNNFKVSNLPYDNEETGKTENITHRLFHNTYRQLSGEFYVNFTKRKWADLFKITLNSYGFDKELQNDFSSRNRPYGAAKMKEYAYAIPSIQYKKSFLENRLQLSQFLVFSHFDNALVDTLKNAYYDWYGNKHSTISGSETGIDFSNLKESVIHTGTNNLTYRGLFTYYLKKNQKLIFNIIDTYLNRIADDLNTYHSKTKVHYNRLIIGMGYQYYLFNNHIEGHTQTKFLSSQTKGNVDNLLTGTSQEKKANFGFSFAQSFKYQSSNGWLLRVSAENTYRLPDQMEIFGDNVFIMPNLSLKPEKSINVNIGVVYTKKGWFKIEANAYYRYIRDMIRLKEITQMQSQYLNLDKVSGFGIELETAVYPVKGLEISGNVTYNGFRYKGSNDNINQNQHFYNARVSNMPFYFGNAHIGYQSPRLFTKKDHLNVYWDYNYVHQFYLDFIEKKYEPNGFLGLFGKSAIQTNRVIPVQQTHSAGLTWQIELKKKKLLAISGEINNIFNAKVYNNFKMQSAGRSLFAKISFNF